jgi:hypothetical protein
MAAQEDRQRVNLVGVEKTDHGCLRRQLFEIGGRNSAAIQKLTKKKQLITQSYAGKFKSA